jgi:hypothetical protein
MSDDLPDNLKRPNKSSWNNTTSKILIGTLAAVIIAALSFWAGTGYHSGAKAAINVSAKSFGSGYGGGRGGYGGGFGLVTAISPTSISTQNARSGSATTYAITSSTVITASGATVTYSDIQVGDTVIVRASSSSTTTAADINVIAAGNNSVTGTTD